jgi:curved DNA-binding protein CbpA
MRNFYSVLRVAPRASDAEIKSAFRNLAKTCHPDVKPGDSEAEAAFQEVKRAYKFLSNPETRKVYDEFLVSRRAAARRRFKRAAATMSASFVLTAASVLLAAVLVQEGGLPFASGRGLAEGPAGSSVQQPRSRAPAAAAEAPERRGDAVTEKLSGP